MNLESVSDDDLKSELQRREALAQAKALQRRQVLAAAALDNIDTLLTFVTEHTRTSCSDDNIANQDRCSRCFLLHAQLLNYFDDDYVVEINVRREVSRNEKDSQRY